MSSGTLQALQTAGPSERLLLQASAETEVIPGGRRELTGRWLPWVVPAEAKARGQPLPRLMGREPKTLKRERSRQDLQPRLEVGWSRSMASIGHSSMSILRRR